MASFFVMILNIVQILLDVAWWIIFVQFILSILISFNVINTYNEFVRSIWNGLNTVTEPVYRPIRRMLPDTGTLDFAPLIVLILIRIISGAVLPWLYQMVSSAA